MRKNNLKKDYFLKVKNLSKKYYFFNNMSDRLRFLFNINIKNIPSFLALNKISFELKKGDALAIIGENGSGKSSLLQIIAGISEPLKGKVISHGRIAALLELGAGFNQEFTGRENIYLYGALYGLSKKEIDQKINDIIVFSGIHDFIDHELRLYSSGMLVRLAFSVIAHIDADILIIDEALAVGDIVFQQKCIDYLLEFKKTKILIFVSHDESLVLRLADTGIYLKDGKVSFKGPASKALNTYHSDVLKQNATESNFNFFNFDSTFTHKKNKVYSDKIKSLIEENVSSRDVKIVSDGSVKIHSYFYKMESDNKICFYILYELNKLVNGLVIGMTIKDSIGQNIIEINNLDKPFTNNKLNLYATARISFEMPELKSGQYSVDIAFGDKSLHKQSVFLWAYNIGSLSLKTNAKFNAIFYPKNLDIDRRLIK